MVRFELDWFNVGGLRLKFSVKEVSVIAPSVGSSAMNFSLRSDGSKCCW